MSDTPKSNGSNVGNQNRATSRQNVTIPINIGEIKNEVKSAVEATVAIQMEQIQASIDATQQLARGAWEAANETCGTASQTREAAQKSLQASNKARETAHNDSEANKFPRILGMILSFLGPILVALIALIPSCSRQSQEKPDKTTSTTLQVSITDETAKAPEVAVSDVYQGYIGKEIAVDGGIYVGEWKDGKRNGKGKIVYDADSPRDYYEGDWANDKCHGNGRCVYKQGLAVDEVYGPMDYYEGNWQDDDYSGKGKLTFENGAWYDGDWVNGERNGYGILLTPDSDGKEFRYEGLWENGKRHGYGKIYNVQSGGYEACEFKEGKPTMPKYHFDKNDTLWLVSRDDGKWKIDWSTRTISPY